MKKRKVYYTDEYRECHKNLSRDGQKSLSKAQNLYDKVTNDFSDFEDIVGGTDGWEGQMAELFTKEYFSYVSSCYDTMSQNILNSLELGCREIDELVVLFDDLKITSERYSNLLIEYSIEKAKNIQPLIRITNSKNKVTNNYVVNPDYDPWIKRLNELYMQIEELSFKLEELKLSIFDTLNDIERFDENVVELFSFIDCINLTIGEDIVFYERPMFSEKSSMNESLYKYSHNGDNYSIICDGYFLNLYEGFIQKNGYYQKRGNGWYPSRCDVASTVFASNLNNGVVRGNWLANSKNIKGSGLTDDYVSVVYNSEDNDALINIKNDVYHEIMAGRACALQVTGASSSLRHWVTVIGLKDSVKGPEDLTPENILVIDNWDGEVQALSEAGRDFFAWESSSRGTSYQMKLASSEERASILANRSENNVFASR